MDSRRTILIIALLVMSFFMYQQWTFKDAANAPGVDSQSNTTASNTAPQPSNTSSIPQANEPASGVTDIPGAEIASAANNSDTVRVTTDMFDISIALLGGDIVRAELREHAETLGEEPRYSILFQRPGEIHIAESGLTGPDGFDNAAGRPTYTTTSNHFELSGDTLRVPLTYIAENGSRVTKEFVFTRGDYAVDVHHRVENNTNLELRMALYGRLTQTMVDNGRTMFMPTYRGAAYSSENDRYKKYSFKDIKKRNLDQSTSAGWIAMLEHYFVTAWVPDQSDTNHLRTTTSPATNDARISFVGPMITIPAGATTDFERSEEHTSELQSRPHLVCRLLLEKKNMLMMRWFSLKAARRFARCSRRDGPTRSATATRRRRSTRSGTTCASGGSAMPVYASITCC